MLAPNTNTLARVALTLLAVGGVISTLVWAGPLNPPGGAVSSTYKTLTEVEPRIAINSTNTPGDADSLYKITQPGSYYLTGNIAGVAAKHGIEIAASGVTLDLNGFELIGAASMGNFDGVTVTTSGLTNIAVFNGSIRNWGSDGIDLASANTTNGRIEDIHAIGNTRVGVYSGRTSLIARCSTSGGQYGIWAGYNATIVDCAATECTLYGMGCDSNCVLSHCSVYSNISRGILLGTGGTLIASSVGWNGNDGVTASNGCAIVDCSFRSNASDGILCSGSCIVRGNTCSSNGNTADGANIHITGADNRVEGNNCIGADRGIDVDTAGNIIIKNTCSGNTTNWDVVAGNTILVVQGSSAGAVLGNTGGTAPGSTDPNANFSY